MIKKDLCSVYKQMLKQVYQNGYEQSPRDKKIRELLNQQFEIQDPTILAFKNQIRSTPLEYLYGELKWYFSGSNRLEDIVHYSTFWKHIANEDGTCNSAYGYRLFVEKNKNNVTQWQWAYKSLSNDKDSRQAIMYIGQPNFQYQGNKDLPCTSFLQFFIRDNKLHLICTMRSNDLIKGTTFDIPFFMLLLQNMRLLLLEKYPELELGSYYHNAMSLHIYEPDFAIVEKMIKRKFTPLITFNMEKPILNNTGEYNQEHLDILLGTIQK